jgi:deoxyribodipyrimidine photo-lyase
MSLRQYLFLQECIESLSLALNRIGQPLLIRVGEAEQVLTDIAVRYNVQSIHSHQETWNGWVRIRNQQIQDLCNQRGITWYEYSQHGVIRHLASRDGWAKQWYQSMSRPILLPPTKIDQVIEKLDSWPTPDELGLKDDYCTGRQTGGREQGLKCLNSFLYERGEHYTKEMSSPLTAVNSCSRLSPHISFGTLSIKEIFQALQYRQAELKMMPKLEKGSWPSAMSSFSARLRWHCHFIQKLEDEPTIEFENLHPAYNGLRKDCNEAYLEAWKHGQTGYPMIDACMRSLITTGWLNFRMRAMLVSFASYHLWLDWRHTAPYLARCFTDYEPGIHYSQFQMQSGTTGMNALRIYNPMKQGIDQDPYGEFIKTWLPELGDVEMQYIHIPWESGMNLDYPPPIVDEKEARAFAREQFGQIRKTIAHRNVSASIVKKHASRKQSRKKPPKPQGEFPI